MTLISDNPNKKAGSGMAASRKAIKSFLKCTKRLCLYRSTIVTGAIAPKFFWWVWKKRGKGLTSFENSVCPAPSRYAVGILNDSEFSFP